MIRMSVCVWVLHRVEVLRVTSRADVVLNWLVRELAKKGDGGGGIGSVVEV